MIDYNSLINSKSDNIEKNNLLIIDGDFILYIVTNKNKVLDQFGKPELDPNGNYIYYDKNLEEVKGAIDSYLNTLFTGLNASEYIGFIGGNIRNYFRKKYYPNYKENRKKIERPQFISEAKQYLIDQYHFIPVDIIETDDAVNITRLHYPNSIPVVVDKDLKSLEGKWYDAYHNVFVNTTLEEQDKFIWSQMITGDTSDGVSGIPKRGIKYFEKIVQENEMRAENSLPVLIYEEYISHYGLERGIEEFYANWKALHILKSIEELPQDCTFTIPEPIKIT